MMGRLELIHPLCVVLRDFRTGEHGGQRHGRKQQRRTLRDYRRTFRRGDRRRSICIQNFRKTHRSASASEADRSARSSDEAGSAAASPTCGGSAVATPTRSGRTIGCPNRSSEKPDRRRPTFCVTGRLLGCRRGIAERGKSRAWLHRDFPSKARNSRDAHQPRATCTAARQDAPRHRTR